MIVASCPSQSFIDSSARPCLDAIVMRYAVIEDPRLFGEASDQLTRTAVAELLVLLAEEAI